MQDEIFNLLMMILMMENGGGTGNINQLILMFLLMNSGTNGNIRRDGDSERRNCSCRRDDGDFTF